MKYSVKKAAKVKKPKLESLKKGPPQKQPTPTKLTEYVEVLQGSPSSLMGVSEEVAFQSLFPALPENLGKVVKTKGPDELGDLRVKSVQHTRSYECKN